MALLECVANISEGINPTKIEAIATSIRSVPKVDLIHVDTGVSANRSVFTFVGPPENLMEAAFRMYEKVYELVDMSVHTGTHPRQGAVDVCPFIPLSDISLKETNRLCLQFGERLHRELGIGGYYYGFSALDPSRSNLALLRKGQYESLPEKLKKNPLGFGNTDHWKKFGVTVIGCRNLLVAYNVNLNTRDVDIAHKIAQRVRASGWLQKKNDESLERVYGRLKSVMGLGWYIHDFDIVQASYNLTDLGENGMLDVFNATVEVAREFDVEVTGSELIGLTPLSELEKAARYLNPSINQDIPQVLESSISYLGLNSLREFNPYEQVLDFKIGQEIKP